MARPGVLTKKYSKIKEFLNLMALTLILETVVPPKESMPLN